MLSRQEGDNRAHLMGLPKCPSMLAKINIVQDIKRNLAISNISKGIVRAGMRQGFPDDSELILTEWKRIWRILTSVCITCLWMQRNRVVFQKEKITLERSMNEFWTTGMRQIRALAKRLSREPEHQIRGTRLQL
ncbi:LOW QUALITY PROTEIN: hypothetical protein PHPALM_2908 [Phytophthora palmivora]|uniref:Uncharacterized protein n=1 Tax=Phytophthora palmivora TaxID=4796 RepID=A0A2P4YNP7_9STRA|nr:LOW QUALITY PROTEIN: hypothetical protein PHPALM_2908 [Phytophthora palmivora]